MLGIRLVFCKFVVFTVLRLVSEFFYFVGEELGVNMFSSEGVKLGFEFRYLVLDVITGEISKVFGGIEV